MSIESEIERGNFVVGECLKCKKTVWPPTKYCNICFGDVTAKKISTKGKILEFSKQDETYFCLVEFNEGVKIIGKIIKGIPKNNQFVSMAKCGINNGGYFFDFELI